MNLLAPTLRDVEEDLPGLVESSAGVWVFFAALRNFRAVAEPQVELELVASLLPAPEELEEDLAGAAAPPLNDLEERREWLLSIGHLALAAEALEALEPNGPLEPWRRLAPKAHECVRSSQMLIEGWADRWIFAGLAEWAEAAGVEDTLPWRLLVPRGEELRAEDLTPEVLHHWFASALHETDDEALARLVARDAEANRVYREELTLPPNTLSVPVSPTALWSELLDTRPEIVWEAPFVHAGPGGRLVVQVDRAGVVARLEGVDGTIFEARAAPEGDLEIEDPLLGTLRISLEASPVPSSWVLDQAFLAASSAIQAQPPPTGLLRALIATFREELDAEESPMTVAAGRVLAAVRRRAFLERRARAWPDLGLTDDLEALDEAVAGWGEAVEGLEPDDLEEALEGTIPERASWWVGGTLEEALVPQAALEAVFDRLVERPRTPFADEDEGEIIALFHGEIQEPRLGVADGFEALPTTPEGLVAKPGMVPLLVLRSKGAAEVAKADGLVVGLRIRFWKGITDPFAASHGLARLAREAVRDAYQAVAAHCPHGRPPRPLAEHRFELLGLDQAGLDLIEGDSLGLPMALAFASLWLDRPLPPKLAATGSLILAEGTLIGRVEGVDTKAQGLARRFFEQGWRLLRPSENPEVALPASFIPDPKDRVPTLVAALERAGMNDLINSTFEPRFSDLATLKQTIRAQVERAELQDLDTRGENPWWLLGDHLRLLALELAGRSRIRRDDELRVDAQVSAARAFLHAAAPYEAHEILRKLEQERLPSSELRVQLRITELSNAISEDDWTNADRLAQQLVHQRDDPDLESFPLVRGTLFGTLGRYRLHRREPETAVDWFEQAIRVFMGSDESRHEVARSVCYLGNALRVRGLGRVKKLKRTKDLVEARDLLQVLGNAELEHEVRPYSQSYFESTSMYRNYELARVHLDLGDPEPARRWAERALVVARRRGNWPQIGILRTLRWSLLRLHDEQGAAAVAEQIRTFEDQIGGSYPPLQRAYHEGLGPYREDGEIY